jgi:DNA (cytosine-5)-methyltransferase 1
MSSTTAFAQNQREEVRELEVAGALPSIRRGDAKNETLLAEVNAFDARQSNVIQYGDKTGPLDTTGVQQAAAVRRLTPRECERLQGFPDDYTAIPYKGKPAVDGPRYKALGNSMAVPVMRWS